MLLGRLMTSYQHGSGISLLLQHANKLTNKKALPAHEGSALPVKPYRAVGSLCSAFSHFPCIFYGRSCINVSKNPVIQGDLGHRGHLYLGPFS